MKEEREEKLPKRGIGEELTEGGESRRPAELLAAAAAMEVGRRARVWAKGPAGHGS